MATSTCPELERPSRDRPVRARPHRCAPPSSEPRSPTWTAEGLDGAGAASHPKLTPTHRTTRGSQVWPAVDVAALTPTTARRVPPTSNTSGGRCLRPSASGERIATCSTTTAESPADNDSRLVVRRYDPWGDSESIPYASIRSVMRSPLTGLRWNLDPGTPKEGGRAGDQRRSTGAPHDHAR